MGLASCMPQESSTHAALCAGILVTGGAIREQPRVVPAHLDELVGLDGVVLTWRVREDSHL